MSTSRHLGRGTWRICAAALLASILACGGGGGGGGGPTQPPAQQITFTPASGGGGTRLSLAQGTASTASTLILELRAQQAGNLYGVAFDLTYPNAVLRYDRATEGTFLSAGSGTSFQVVETSPGRLVVGVSRLGASGGVGGNGLVLSLELSAIAAGTGTFAFQENLTYGPDGLGQNGVAWDGGTVQVVR